MNEKEVLLAKAKAKTLAHHFKKAAAHHDVKAAAHLKAHEAHKAHADHHQEMMDDMDGDEGKVHKSHHKASMAFHKSKAAHHEKMHKAHSSHADHYRAMASAHEADEAEKVFKLAGMEEEPLTTRPITAQPAEDVSKTQTPAPATTPAAPTTQPAPAAQPAAEGINETIQKALDNKLTEAVSAAFERVLSSQEFNQKVDSAIASKLLEKLGSSTVESPIRTFPVPRAGDTPAVPAVASKATVVDIANLDPELADLCKVE